MTKYEVLKPLEFDFKPEDEMVQLSAEFMNLMSGRRSIRSFSNKSFSDEIIFNAIKTAGSAPSGANKQPWHFCVVKDASIKQKVREMVEQEEKENYERRFSEEMKKDISRLQTNYEKPHLTDAPYVIVVFKENFRLVDGIRRKNYYVNESVGIACGFFIAALHQAGLGTLTHTPNPMKFLNELLNRPANETPVLVLPVGYPSDDAEVPDISRKSLQEIMSIS